MFASKDVHSECEPPCIAPMGAELNIHPAFTPPSTSGSDSEDRDYPPDEALPRVPGPTIPPFQKILPNYINKPWGYSLYIQLADPDPVNGATIVLKVCEAALYRDYPDEVLSYWAEQGGRPGKWDDDGKMVPILSWYNLMSSAIDKTECAIRSNPSSHLWTMLLHRASESSSPAARISETDCKKDIIRIRGI